MAVDPSTVDPLIRRRTRAMRALHAAARHAGMTHEDLHRIAEERGVGSLKELSLEQLRRFAGWVRRRGASGDSRGRTLPGAPGVPDRRVNPGGSLRSLAVLVALVVMLLAAAPRGRTQNPETAVFPGAVATDNDLLAWKNRSETTLSAGVSDSTLTLPVADGSGFIAPSVVTVNNERMKVCAAAAGSLTVCAGGRGFDGSSASGHNANAIVKGYVPAYWFNQAAAELKAIETALGVNLANVAAATHSHDVSDDTNLSADGQGVELVGDEIQLELDGATLAKSASGLLVSSVAGVAGADADDLSDDDTDDLSEGLTNLYYQDARARAALSATAPVSYDSGTGAIGLTEVGDALVSNAITLDAITQITSRAITDLTGVAGRGQLPAAAAYEDEANVFTADQAIDESFLNFRDAEDDVQLRLLAGALDLFNAAGTVQTFRIDGGGVSLSSGQSIEFSEGSAWNNPASVVLDRTAGDKLNMSTGAGYQVGGVDVSLGAHFDGSYNSLSDVPTEFAPSAHAASHQAGGGDVLDVSGLTGADADDLSDDAISALSDVTVTLWAENEILVRDGLGQLVDEDIRIALAHDFTSLRIPFFRGGILKESSDLVFDEDNQRIQTTAITVNSGGYLVGGAALNFSHLAGAATDLQVADTISLTSIGQAGDVDLTGLADGNCLIYDGVTDSRFEPGSCGGSPGGSDTHIQRNSSGSFAGSAFHTNDLSTIKVNVNDSDDVLEDHGVYQSGTGAAFYHVERPGVYEYSWGMIGGGSNDWALSTGHPGQAGKTGVFFSGPQGVVHVDGNDARPAANPVFTATGTAVGVGANNTSPDGDWSCRDNLASIGDTLCVMRGGPAQAGNLFEIQDDAGNVNAAITAAGAADLATVELGASGAIAYPPSASEPADCTAGGEGSNFYNTTDGRQCFCADDDGDAHFEWVKGDDYSHATGHCSI